MQVATYDQFKAIYGTLGIKGSANVVASSFTAGLVRAPSRSLGYLLRPPRGAILPLHGPIKEVISQVYSIITMPFEAGSMQLLKDQMAGSGCLEAA